ncbi:MAG: phage tail sheath subtilisin-like domain-containing protein [Anaerolineae bacterium]|nr:phage tail sheath subtilisin-like domain-containing protein [Anaerolineae bacterium]
MPVTPTYPGVYIEEVPSGVRTISGVATSIAAFVGWAAKGPTDRAQLVLSWSDFERTYGGLDVRSLLGYSVYHFFNNGGQQAYIVRLAAGDAAVAEVTLDSKLKVTGKNAGDWAEAYGVTVKRRADDSTRFRLQVLYRPDGAAAPVVVESFENLSLDSRDPRFAPDVLAAGSAIVNAALTVAPSPVPSFSADITTAAMLQNGADGAVLEPNNGPFETALQAGGGSGGVNLLRRVDLFNLLVVPGETKPSVVAQLQKFARDHRAFLIVDSNEGDTFAGLSAGPDNAVTGADAINAALYFPWVKAPDPKQENRLRHFPPSGFVAGVYARTDVARGVWKAPAGTEASLSGVSGVAVPLTDLENGTLNIQAINCIRNFSVYGNVVWGARTLQGNDERGSEWKYVPVRRLALFLEESLYRGLKWVVFEPNDEPLWAQIRLNVGAFMHDLFRQGAFQGVTPREAYFVKCDKETTTQSDRNRGIVNILVGFAPLKPAEFVILKIQQMAGQLQA